MLSVDSGRRIVLSNQYGHWILNPQVTSSYGACLGQTNWSGVV